MRQWKVAPRTWRLRKLAGLRPILRPDSVTSNVAESSNVEVVKSGVATVTVSGIPLDRGRNKGPLVASSAARPADVRPSPVGRRRRPGGRGPGFEPRTSGAGVDVRGCHPCPPPARGSGHGSSRTGREPHLLYATYLVDPPSRSPHNYVRDAARSRALISIL